MKALLRILPLFFCLPFAAQTGLFANLQYKKHFPDQDEWVFLKLKGSDSVITCMKYYFKSDDTLYFREFPSQQIHKICESDLQETTFLTGKDYKFALKNQNLKLAALQPKIFLGLSAASLAAMAVDLAQPRPFCVKSPQLALTPLFFLLAYHQTKKMDRYLNYYQMAEAQKYTKPERPKVVNIASTSQPKTRTTDTTQVPANTNSSTISDEYRYGTSEVPVVKTLSTTSGCQYILSDYYFQSDGNFYFAIEGQAGTFYMKKDEVVRLDGVTDLGIDKKFATERFVLEKARTGKVIGVLYGIGGTFIWGVIIGVATWEAAPGIAGGIGLGAGPAALIVRKCNTTIRNYKIFNEAIRVTCN